MATEEDLKEVYRPTFDRDRVPLVLNWTCHDVGRWVRKDLGFPQYEDCFMLNYITGRKLIQLDISSLQKIGIQDFEDLKNIARKIRELLGVEEPYWNRSIFLPPFDIVSHFLERKSISGKESDALTFEDHVRQLQHFDRHDDGKGRSTF